MPFDPMQYLTKVSGQDYLQVKWRVLWFHEQHPDGSIATELVSHQNHTAIFKAVVSWPSETGLTVRTGYGMESSGDFGDYLEKAETKAIGRALALSGFGTQFSGVEFDEQHRIVDSPAAVRPLPARHEPQRPPPPMRQQPQQSPQGQQGGGYTQGDLAGRHYPTVGQLKIARPVASAAGLDWDSQANDIIFAAIGVATTNGTVNRNDAFAEVVEWMRAHEGNEGQWAYDGNGHLVLGPVGPATSMARAEMREDSLDDVPF